MENQKKDIGIQVLRSILFFGIVAFHFGLPGAEIMWGGGTYVLSFEFVFFEQAVNKIAKTNFALERNKA